MSDALIYWTGSVACGLATAALVWLAPSVARVGAYLWRDDLRAWRRRMRREIAFGERGSRRFYND